MPQILRFLTDIAREKQRDILVESFYCEKWEDGIITLPPSAAIEKMRIAFIVFLDTNKIAYEECVPPFAESFLTCPYDGTLYLDVPYNPCESNYDKVASYLENPDGSLRDPDVRFLLLTLESCLRRRRAQAEEEF